ncbi:MAG: DUF1178 family protein [Casimicrobiaceae bacterium]
MIIFELACGQGHRFEGWFGSSEEFARQSETRMVRCPVCDDAGVARIPSAKVRKGGISAVRPTASDAAPAEAAPGQQAIAGLPAELMAKLREMVRSAENVGPRFPEEARKIHYDEAPPRAIRGQASKEESEALADEGIGFSTLPDFLLRETH